MEGNEKAKMPLQAENEKNYKNEDDIGEKSVDSEADHDLKVLEEAIDNDLDKIRNIEKSSKPEINAAEKSFVVETSDNEKSPKPETCELQKSEIPADEKSTSDDHWNMLIIDIPITPKQIKITSKEIKFVIVNGMSLKEKVAKVNNILETFKNPSKIVVAIFNEIAGMTRNTVIQNCINDINDLNKKVGKHTLIFSAAILRPDMEFAWTKIEELNEFISKVNIANKISTCNPNKHLTKTLIKKGPNNEKIISHQIKPRQWKEIVNKTGRGTNLNENGIRSICSYYSSFFKVLQSFAKIVLAEDKLKAYAPKLSTEKSAQVTYKNMVIIDMPMNDYDISNEDNHLKINYFLRNGCSVERLTEKVIEKLEALKSPHKITLFMFNYLAGKIPNEKLIKSVEEIDKGNKKIDRHKIVFASCIYKPAFEHNWPKVHDFNAYLRNINVRNQMPDSYPFKFLSKQGLYQNEFRCFSVHSYWQEFKDRRGLGNNLNTKGKIKLQKYFTNYYFSEHFEENLFLNGRMPAPLNICVGFSQLFKQEREVFANAMMTEQQRIFKNRFAMYMNREEQVHYFHQVENNHYIPDHHLHNRHAFDSREMCMNRQEHAQLNPQVQKNNYSLTDQHLVDRHTFDNHEMSSNVENEEAKQESRIKDWNIGDGNHWKSYETNFVPPAKIKSGKDNSGEKETNDELLKLELENERIRNEILLSKLENQRIKEGLKNEREGGTGEYSDSEVEEMETDFEDSRSCHIETENHQQRDNEGWGSRSRSPEGYHERQKGRGKNHRSRSRERDWDRPQNFRNRETEERYYESENTCREDANQTNDYDTLRSRNREYDRNNRSRSGDRSREYDPSFRDRSRDHDPYRERSREHDHSYRDRSREYDPSYTERSREYDPYRERSRVYDPSFREISGEYDPSHSERSREYDLSYRDRSREYDSYRERSREYDPCYRERSRKYDTSYRESSREYDPFREKLQEFDPYRERSREYDHSYRERSRDNHSSYRARDQDPLYRDSSRENNPDHREIPREYNSTHDMDRSTEYDISYRERYPEEQERYVNRESRDYHQEDLNRESERNRQSYNNRSSNDNHRIDNRDERVEDENNHHRKDDYHRNESDHHSNRRYSDDRTDYQNRKRRHSHERRSKERRLKYSSPDSRKSTSPVSDIVLDMPVASSRSSREHERSKSSLNKVPEKQAEKVNPKLSNVKLPTPVSTFRTRGYINTSKSNKASNPYEEEKDEEQQQDLNSPNVTNAAWNGPYPNSQGPGKGPNISQGPGNNPNLENWIPPVTGPPGVRNLAPGILGQPPMIPAGPPQPYKPLVPPSQLLGPPPPLNVPAPAPPINVPDTQTLLELHGYVKKQQSTKTLSDYRINF